MSGNFLEMRVTILILINIGVAPKKYNCAGLAFRNYQFLNVTDFITFLEENNKEIGNEGDIKFYLWEFSYRPVDENGNSLPLGFGVQNKSKRDFHIVSGPLGPGGSDPVQVLSKNGIRPVLGPKPPLSWAPESGPVQAYAAFDIPAYYYGNRVHVNITFIKLRTFIVPCTDFRNVKVIK